MMRHRLDSTGAVPGRASRRATSALGVVGAAAGLLGFPGGAVADIVDAAASTEVPSSAVTLYQATTLVTGASFSRVELQAPGAGRIDITLTDLNFLGPLDDSSLAIANGGGVLAMLDGPGSLSFEVPGPMALFAYIYTVGNLALGSSTSYVKIEAFVVPPPIPLPPALWAFLGGAGLVGWLARRRDQRAVTNL